MIYLFLLFFVPFAFLVWSAHKYANPYKLVFIFGKKGAGKSCYMVRKMLWYIRHGWHVYTDMEDIRIPGVRIISVHDLSVFQPEPHSALFLDEVGISMDNRSFKTFPPGLRDFFKYSRKMKCCIYMNSQAYDVDKKVRDTTDGMLLITSIAHVISFCRPILRTVTLTEPSAEAESRVADCLRFSSFLSWRFYYMPFYFKYFDSRAMPHREDLPYRDPLRPDPAFLHLPYYILIKEAVTYVRSKLSHCLFPD